MRSVRGEASPQRQTQRPLTIRRESLEPDNSISNLLFVGICGSPSTFELVHTCGINQTCKEHLYPRGVCDKEISTCTDAMPAPCSSEALVGEMARPSIPRALIERAEDWRRP